MKSKAKRVMLQMGFSISNDGFHYIVDALEMIREDPTVKYTYVYTMLAKKYKKGVRTIERSIRWEIQSYYNECKVHPLLNATNTTMGQFPLKEFLMRLYVIIYEPEMLEGED